MGVLNQAEIDAAGYTPVDQVARTSAAANQILNLKPSNTRKWRTALARYQAGAANATLVILGNSTVRGLISGVATGQQFPNAASVRLGQLLARRGEAVETQAIMGSGHVSNSAGTLLPASDRRITDTGSPFSGVVSIGGLMWTMNAAASRTITPETTVDTFLVHYASTASTGSFSYSVDGGAATTVNTTGGSVAEIRTLTVPVSLGSHALTLSWVSGTVRILGVRPQNSTRKAIEIINAGANGARSIDLATNAGSIWEPRVSIPAVLKPDLTIIEGGIINDWRGATPVANVRAALQDLITQCSSTGDVMLMTPVYDNGQDVSTQQPYIDMMKALATSADVPLIDLNSYRGPYANATALYSDVIHGSVIGYADDAQLMLRAVAPMGA